MKRFPILLAALAAAIMTSCVGFKTEATVDVEVTQKGKPLAGVTVYKFNDKGLGEGSTLYKDNATGHAQTNGGGIAHFELKSPDDLDPSNIAGQDFSSQAIFYFCTYDTNGDRNALVASTVKTGDKLTLKLDVPEGLVNDDND